MLQRSIRKVKQCLLRSVTGGLVFIVIIRHFVLVQNLSQYDPVLQENAESARQFERVEYIYIQDEDLKEANILDIPRSLRNFNLKPPPPNTVVQQDLNQTDGNVGLSEWNPFISEDSLTGNHTAVKFNILHWMDVWTNCTDYFSTSVKQRLVYPYYHGNCRYDPKAPPITLATQMDTSITYWEKLVQTAQNWNGPVSIGLHVTLDDLSQMEGLKTMLEERFEKLNLHKFSVCVHLLIEKTQDKENRLYPINSLRNVAIKYSQTRYIFYTEADFIPMPGLAGYMYNKTKHMNTTKMALIIPAFRSPKPLLKFPNNRTELLEQWQLNITVPWCQDREWKDGHLPTQYHRIPDATMPYQVNYTSSYEPYYIIEKEKAPYYPEEVLYGRQDKIIHTALMNKLGYQFVVMPGTFIIHTPHAKTNHYKLTEYQIRCASTAVKNLLRKIKYMNKNSLKNYMKTHIKVSDRQMLESKIKVRVREPNAKDVILPVEMMNSSIYIKHIPKTYRRHKKFISQRFKAQVRQSMENRKAKEQEHSESAKGNFKSLEYRHWWAYG